jgi:sugar phosphate isomerase/epimerase
MNERVCIRIGNQTAISASTVMEPFECAVAKGFDAFEWFPDRNETGAGWTEADISKETRDFIKDTALAHDISLSVHVPWRTNALVSGALETFLGSIEFARDIGASLLNTHLYCEGGVRSYARAILPLLEALAPTAIRLAIENTSSTGPEDFNEFFRVLQRLLGPSDASSVGMCLDLGHANLCEKTRNDYLKFLDLLDPAVPIIHVHMHENYGDYDSHLLIFTGPAGKDTTGIRGFIERLKKRKFSGSIILEQWPKPPTLLDEARRRLQQIIGDCSGPQGVAPATLGTPLAAQSDDFSAAIVGAEGSVRAGGKNSRGFMNW